MKKITALYEEKDIDKLLRLELKMNGIDVLNRYETKFPNLYEILKKMLYVDEHEGKLPRFGIIFSTQDLSKHSKEVLYFKNKDIDLSLRLSDGKNSFLWFGENKELNGIVLFDDFQTNEHNLLIASSTMKSIVFTYENGEVKIYADGNIYIHENRKWRIKDGIENKVNRILELTNYKYPKIMKQLIEFAYYELSPRKIGSTLVYLLDTTNEKIMDLNPPLKFSEYKMNFNKKSHNSLVKNFLKQVDGATLVFPNGDIWGTGLHLQYSKKSKEIISEDGGTRHTSAKRFTFDYSSSIVVVTSEDGPVTVYTDGIGIPLSMPPQEFAEKFPRAECGVISEGLVIKSDIATCKKCGKAHRIEMIKSILFALDRSKTIYCKTCGEELYRTKAKILDYKIIK